MRAAGRKDQLYSPQNSNDLIEVYRRSGRPEDFEQIVRRFAALVLSETRRVTRNSHDAEDASQLTFLALAMEIKSGTNILRIGPWLQRVSRRQALKIVRSRGRRQRREDKVRKSELQLVDADKPIDQAVAAGIIRDAIDQLPERYRLPVVLHYFGGMTLEMIAAEMKITRQTVGTRLHRGRKMLANSLGKQGVVLDSITLARAMAVLVPAAVIESVMRAAQSMHAPSGAAALPATVTHMLRTVSFAAMKKPLRVAMLAAFIACGTRGIAWAVHSSWQSLRPTQAVQWLEHLLRFHPNWSFSFEDDPDATPPAPSAESMAGLNQTTSVSHIPFNPSWADPLLGQSIGPAVKSNESVAIQKIATDQRDSKTSTLASSLRAESIETATANSAISSPVNPGFATAMSVPTTVKADHSQSIAEQNNFSEAASSLVIGTQPRGEDDRVALVGGTHRFSNIDVGETGNATLAITADANVSAQQMRVGVAAGSSGTVIQQGGHVSVGPLVVGDGGTGEYDISDGGQLDVGQLTLGAQPMSRGQMKVASGEVLVTQPNGNVTIGEQGNGILLLGSMESSGAVHAASAASVPVVVRDQADAKGLILGWGAVGTGGTLINNGRVVADGFNHVRTLDLTHFSKIDNTIDNPPDGNNGWFVQRGGRIALPAMQIDPVVHTYTWGESSTDPTIDLVNSVRMNVYGQPTPATVSLTLRTATPADPLDVPLPQDVALVGLWQIDSTQFDPALVNYVVRYDAQAANFYATGEAAIGLYAYNGQWQAADDLSRDSADHLVSGDFKDDGNGPISYLAVGVAYQAVYGTVAWNSVITSGQRADELVIARLAPEPSGVALLLVVGACSLKRARRRELGQGA